MADQGIPGDAKRLLDQSQDKIAVLDEEGRFRYANRATERILGYDPSELVGENAFEYVHPDDRERVRDTFAKIVSATGEVSETLEYRFRTADGSWVWFESRVSNRGDPAVGGYVVSSRDISERKATEEARQTISAYLRELARNTNDALWMFTADWGEVLFVNSAYEELYGRPVSGLEADATDFVDAVHPDDRDIVREAMETVSGGEPIEIEYRVNPDEDFRRWVWVKARPVREEGEVMRVVGFSRDVTGRRRRERQLRIMDRMLRHNLRNEMNVVIGHAREAMETADEEAKKHLDPIVATCKELLESAEKERSVVKMLLDRRPEETVDVGTAIRDTVNWARAEYPAADVESSQPESVPATAVPEIDLALRELVENAIEHAGEDPTVRIQVEMTDTEVVVSVADDAPPIPKQEVAVLNDEADEDAVFHGSGLGLWLVYLVVDLSGGELDFDSDGTGNVVEITLQRPGQTTSGPSQA